MPLFWVSAMLVIGANVAYHIYQKFIPASIHVIVSVIVILSNGIRRRYKRHIDSA